MIASAIVVFDQVTKIIALNHLSSGEAIRPVGSDLIWFVLVMNRGGAFGVQILPPMFLAVIAIGASLALAFYLYNRPNLVWHQRIPLTLILGGAVGNLIDRLYRGAVVDYNSVDFPDFLMARWPVFNVADSAVSVGVTLILFFSFFQRGKPDQQSGSEFVEEST